MTALRRILAVKNLRAQERPVRSLIFLVGIVASALSAPAKDGGGDLRLEVHLPPHEHGRLAWAVFNSADGFPGDRRKALRHGFSPECDGESEMQIDAGPLPAGRYAVALYLDENGNGKLDYRLFGIPKEPVGASNNPPGRLGPPRFNDAAFMHRENQTVVIRMVDAK